MKRKNILLAISILAIFLGLTQTLTSVQAQAGNAYDMINEVNALRAANGLPPFSINAALMASAQAHADWITLTGLGGHEGVDGTYAIDRARAAGYGGGATIFVNENWARGYNLSIYDCIYVSWNDPDHMGNMLATWHNEIGAGVSIDSANRVTYILNIGHVSGSAPPPVSTGDPQITVTPYIQPIQTTTPDPTGKITHIVQPGETLWTIATAYGLTLNELLNLNGLTAESIIFPGEILIIRLGTTPEVTPTLEISPTATLKPSQTPRPTQTLVLTPTATPEPEKGPNIFQRIFSGNTRILGFGLIGICVLGLVLLIISSRRIR